MRNLLAIVLIIFLMAQPTNAMEFVAPEAPSSVEEILPNEMSSFGKDLLFVLKSALQKLKPEIAEAGIVCLRIFLTIMLMSLFNYFSNQPKEVVSLVGTLFIGTIMLNSANTMIGLGTKTVTDLSEYGKLILPVMSAALAAQGSINTSTALYTGTVLFSTVLSTLISKILIPVLYLFLCVCIAFSAIQEPLLKRLSEFLKWLLTWSLKIVLYVFTGYMTITGVISGSVDASAVKATKLAINGVVPVIGNILSDASEAILLSAGMMKNSVGTYGLIVFISILIGPFLKISAQYLMLKFSATVSEVLAVDRMSKLISSFSTSMGFLLAMIGTVSLLLLISTICFMKGVA